MSDQKLPQRPLSPHLSIYKPQITSALSIFHRITGVAMAFGALLVTWWFVAGAVSPGYFDFVDGLMTSLIGDLVMFGLLWALMYHALNGIRHLIWDAGRGMDIETVNKSGIFVIGASLVLTLIIALIV